jgi:hypothetical protein
MMMKPFRYLLMLMFLTSLLSCDVFRQTTEMAALGKCDFRIESTRNMKLAGINIQEKKSISDFSMMDMTRIGSAIAAGALPLTFDLNVEVDNPNEKVAAMNRLDWILLIDDVEMTRGILDKRIEIQPGLVSQFPVAMQVDLMKALSGKSGDALINFALNLAGASSRPTKIKLKAKPTILVGTRAIDYPGYITIRHEYGAAR